ncbi:MAG: hypothetical protein D6736_09255 [Nitrospinota bacterium]|nr:MAG: hypothetical protein D6736_09255 [Nitrospinota bacterium]
MREAIDRVRAGKGPVLIEAVTYRIGAHTTADDPTRYRPEQELAVWVQRDPIKRFRLYLQQKGLWSESWEEEIKTESAERIEAAVVQMEESLPPAPEDVFRYTFAQLTPPLQEQQDDFLAFLAQQKEE